MQPVNLNELRGRLIRQEETIIFAFIERAQFCINAAVYDAAAIPLADYDGCFTDYLLHEMERVYSRVRRYTSPDENPFFDDLPAPILESLDFPEVIKPNAININSRILQLYKDNIVPRICKPGDDGNYGSSACCDSACLQAISKRVHYGKFIAEAKFSAEVERYTELIRAGDTDGILEALTDAAVEAHVLLRIEQKAAAYGQDIDVDRTAKAFKIEPAVIAEIYRNWIIPLTKDVEVDYLMERLG
jgi:chorismate mutase